MIKIETWTRVRPRTEIEVYAQDMYLGYGAVLLMRKQRRSS